MSFSDNEAQPGNKTRGGREEEEEEDHEESTEGDARSNDRQRQPRVGIGSEHRPDTQTRPAMIT